MKRFLIKIGALTIGALSTFGLISPEVGANVKGLNKNLDTRITKSNINVQEQTPLYLYHAEELMYDNGELITWHYSHSSHSSHTSHTSHTSHSSHSSHTSSYW